MSRPAVDRRTLLHGALAAASAPSSLMARPRFDRGAPRPLAFAHWHVFPISMDNRPSEADYYTTQYLRPEGERGKFAAMGGYIRERPLPRAVDSSPNWRVDDMAADLALAAAIGIDAFQFNLNALKGSQAWTALLQMLEAASRPGASVKVTPCFDCISLKDTSVADMQAGLLEIAASPAVMRWRDGRMLVSAFAPEVRSDESWKALFEAMSAAGHPVAFFPVFLNIGKAAPALLAASSLVSTWGGSNLGSLPFIPEIGARLRAGGVGWCEPVWSQNFRPKSQFFEESGGSAVFRRDFGEAIDIRADAVNLLTWNDYSEGSEVRPSTGIQHGFSRLARYHMDRFKAGRSLPVREDELIYFHRTQFAGARQTLTKPQKRFDVHSGPTRDEIELVSLCTAPATVEICIGGQCTQSPVPAGLSSTRIPLAEGRPTFRLIRGGRTAVSYASRFTVSATSDYQDLLYRSGSSIADPAQAAG